MFDFLNVKLDESGNSAVSVPVIASASSKDHEDVHYLYRLRKALALLVGNDNMKGFALDQLQGIHTTVVRLLIGVGQTHWYDNWDAELDDTLPEDLKLVSSGYEPPYKKGRIFDLEDTGVYKELLEECGVVELWSAPTARADIPSSHFLDPKNKKYPYKNSDGSVNCGGLQAAYKAARGSRGAPKRPTIAAKAKRLLATHCSKKKAELPPMPKLTRI